jgi:hypothetical protein
MIQYDQLNSRPTMAQPIASAIISEVEIIPCLKRYLALARKRVSSAALS